MNEAKLNCELSKAIIKNARDLETQISEMNELDKSQETYTQLKNRIKAFGSIDLKMDYGTFVEKVLYPVNTEVTTDVKETPKENENRWSNPNNGKPAVGKGFGTLGWKNASYSYGKDIWGAITDKHISLIFNKEKKKIAKDFFDYYTMVTTKFDNKEIIIRDLEIPVNCYAFQNCRFNTKDWFLFPVEHETKIIKCIKIERHIDPIYFEDEGYGRRPEHNLTGILSFFTKNQKDKKEDGADPAPRYSRYRYSSNTEDDVDKKHLIGRLYINQFDEHCFENHMDFILQAKKDNEEVCNSLIGDYDMLLKVPEIAKLMSDYCSEVESIFNQWKEMKNKYAVKILERGMI